MLEKPDLQDSKIIATLEDEYGLNISSLTFLPLGADQNSAVYRAVTADGIPYFVKLRRHDFDDTVVDVPQFLHRQGIPEIIPLQETNTGKLWAPLEDFHLMLYPFIEGRNGYEVPVSDQHWMTLGRVLKRIHTIELPSELRERLKRETFSPYWRDHVRQFLTMAETESFEDPVSSDLAALLNENQTVIQQLISGAAEFATALEAQSPNFVLCHADIHPGNLLIDTLRDTLYIVDWDNPVLAPKERDLMFVGGGFGGAERTLQEEETLFYQGYGESTINPAALVYYRYERIVQDISAYCEEIFLTNAGSADRVQGLRQLKAQFLPDHVIDIAFRSENHQFGAAHPEID